MITLQLQTPDDWSGGRISSLQFSPDSAALAAIFRVGANRLLVAWWDLRRREQTGSDFGALISEDDATPPDPALSPDHRFLARMENDLGGVQRLVLVDRSRPKGRAYRLTAWPYYGTKGYPDGFNFQVFGALTFAPDGSHLYALVWGCDPEDDTGDVERTGIYRWHVPALLRGRGKKSSDHVLPDADFFLKAPLPDVFEWAKFSRSFVAAPDGRGLAVGFRDKQVLGWSLPEGAPLPEMGVKKKRKQPVAWRLAFSPDGGSLAAADEAVTVYATATGQPRLALPPGPAVSDATLRRAPFVYDLAYHPAGRLLATASGDPIVRWWDAATGAERASHDCPIGAVTAVAFSPEGRLCAAGGEDGRVAVWDVAD